MFCHFLTVLWWEKIDALLPFCYITFRHCKSYPNLRITPGSFVKCSKWPQNSITQSTNNSNIRTLLKGKIYSQQNFLYCNNSWKKESPVEASWNMMAHMQKLDFVSGGTDKSI